MGDEIKHALRAMAWERAKGELRSMLATFYGEREKHQKLLDAIDTFVEIVEDHGLQE